jgi:RNA polymerase sigma-70 factor (ECF subfamily)
MLSTPANPATPVPDARRVEEFTALFTHHASRLTGYVMSLVPNWADAEEVLQNTNSVLWKKFDQFAPGSDFFAWACQIARHEVMHYRRSKGRERVRFGDEFIEAIADEAVTFAGELDGLRTALAGCIGKLPEKDRQVIEERYREGATTRSAADVLGRSIDAVYKALGRVRKSLLECIEHELNREVPR